MRANKLVYCPTCRRVYFLPQGEDYLCSRKHRKEVYDGQKTSSYWISRTFGRRPLRIPRFVDVEIREQISEETLHECDDPDDHLQYQKHLTRAEVKKQYKRIFLKTIKP